MSTDMGPGSASAPTARCATVLRRAGYGGNGGRASSDLPTPHGEFLVVPTSVRIPRLRRAWDMRLHAHSLATHLYCQPIVPTRCRKATADGESSPIQTAIARSIAHVATRHRGIRAWLTSSLSSAAPLHLCFRKHKTTPPNQFPGKPRLLGLERPKVDTGAPGGKG